MAEKKQTVDLSTMEGQTRAWEETYSGIAAGAIDAPTATNRIRALRGVYILRVEGPTRMLNLLARLGKDNEEIRTHAAKLTKKVMGTLDATPAIEVNGKKDEDPEKDK
jgi:hypothetical protein